MFKYNNTNKFKNIQRIIDSLKQQKGIIIGVQSAGRIEYLLSQRHFLINSVEISGQDVNTGRTVQLILNIQELAQNIV